MLSNGIDYPHKREIGASFLFGYYRVELRRLCPNYLLYPSDMLSVCSCIVCCFSSSLELNFSLHISHEKVAETFVVDSSDFPCLVRPCISSLFGSHSAHMP